MRGSLDSFAVESSGRPAIDCLMLPKIESASTLVESTRW